MALSWGELFEEWTVKGTEFIEAGDHVVVRVEHEARGSDSGAEVRGTYWYLVRMKQGQGTALEIFATRKSALEVVGLSE